MGREIRKVPPNWEHPRYNEEDAPNSRRIGSYRPMHDDLFDKKFAEWLADFDRVRAGDLNELEQKCYPLGLAEWLVDEGQPLDPAYYRPYKDEEATWVQVYETVSEGTPVTPPFATPQEIVDYLATRGDFWDQERGDGAWSRKAAEQFVGTGSAMSGMMVVSDQGAKFYAPRDGKPE